MSVPNFSTVTQGCAKAPLKTEQLDPKSFVLSFTLLFSRQVAVPSTQLQRLLKSDLKIPSRQNDFKVCFQSTLVETKKTGDLTLLNHLIPIFKFNSGTKLTKLKLKGSTASVAEKLRGRLFATRAKIYSGPFGRKLKGRCLSRSSAISVLCKAH